MEPHVRQVAMTCAYECIKYSLDRDLVGHVKSLESVDGMRTHARCTAGAFIQPR